MSQAIPRMRMFAGPNGSGKSTIKSVKYTDRAYIFDNSSHQKIWITEITITPAMLRPRYKISITQETTQEKLKAAGYIESWGRGIEKINRECREHGISPPRYEYGMSGLMLTFLANPQHLIAPFTERDAKAKQGVAPQKTPVKTLVKTPVKIIELLQSNPYLTLTEVATQIGKSLSAVERASAKLVKDGLLRYVGPQKGGHWEIIKNA